MGCPPSTELHVIRTASALCAALLLTACSQAGANAGKPADLNASLEPEILKWRTEIETTHPACRNKVGGKGCEAFEVTCKGAENLTPADEKKGVTAKVVAAMNFSGRMPDGSTGKGGSAFAEFANAHGTWTRAEARPVNPTTCAAF
jgi:hypothetical protein